MKTDEQKPMVTMAGRIEVIRELTEPRPRYCECSLGCTHIVGFDPPLVVLTPDEIAVIIGAMTTPQERT